MKEKGVDVFEIKEELRLFGTFAIMSGEKAMTLRPKKINGDEISGEFSSGSDHPEEFELLEKAGMSFQEKETFPNSRGMFTIKEKN